MLDAIPLWAWLIAPLPSLSLIAYVVIGRRIVDGRGIVRELRCKENKCRTTTGRRISLRNPSRSLS
jgi:hypothetical protein